MKNQDRTEEQSWVPGAVSEAINMVLLETLACETDSEIEPFVGAHPRVRLFCACGTRRTDTRVCPYTVSFQTEIGIRCTDMEKCLQRR